MRERMRLIWILARSDFRKRYIGSYFGIFWMCIQPVISVLIYYCVFQLGFKNNPVESLPYVVWLLPGIVPWFFFNDAVQNGVGTLISYRHWVKKLYFEIEVLPIVRIIASLFLHVFFIAVMIIVLMLYGCSPSIWWLESIYYLISNLILITALVYLTSAVNVFVKDMGQFVGILLQFGFWLAPIMYEPEIMPKWIQVALEWNPFTYIVSGFRNAFLYQRGFWETSGETAVFWCETGALLVISLLVFRRLKPHFADVL